jgi:type IV secretory pathway ATPase VirB11/archaellum biosynthesis ATPase
VIANPFKNLRRTLSTKLDAAQAARKAAKELKRRLPFTNLNIPEYSEITIYTESHPSGINANIRPHGKEGRPDLRKINQKLISSLATATRDFYYEHQENCLCSTAASLEETLVKDTRRVCKMRTSVAQVEKIVEVEDLEIGQSLGGSSMASQADTVSILEEWEETQTLLKYHDQGGTGR